MAQSTDRFEMRISAELLARIDRARGLAARSAWIKAALTSELNRQEKQTQGKRPRTRKRKG